MGICKRLVAGPLFALVVSALTAAVAAAPLQIACDDLPPYAFLEAGEPTGYSIEMTQAVFRRLGVAVEFRLYPWQRAVVMAREGATDALLNVSYQPDRDNMLRYTPGQKQYLETGKVDDQLWESEYVFFINRLDAGRLDSGSYQEVDAKDLRVGVNRGFSYNEEFQNASFKRVFHNRPQESMAALLNRDIDLYACDRSVGLWLAKTLKMDDQITFVPKTLFSKPYTLAFTRRATHPEVARLETEFYRELKTFKETPEHLRLCEKYGIASPMPQARDLIFVCESWKPFEYEENGRVAGLDAEVVARIMGRLGLSYQIRIYPWSRAWMMVEQGAADAVLSVSYKASREQFLHFTDEQRQFMGNGSPPADYLWLSEYVFFIKEKSLGKFRFESYDQLKADKIRVGTNKGYSYSSGFPAAKIGSREFNSTREGMLALVNEDIDLYPMDRTVGLAELKDMGLQTSITYWPRVLFTKPYLAPFSKISDYPGIEQVMARFNHELRQMRKSGEYDKIYQQYCGGIKKDVD